MARLGRWVMIGVFVVINLLIVLLGIGYITADSRSNLYWRIERAAWACVREPLARELMVPQGVYPEELPELPGCLILRPQHPAGLEVLTHESPLSRIRVTPPGGQSVVLWFPGDALGTYKVEKPKAEKRDPNNRVPGTLLTATGGGAWGCPMSGMVRRAVDGDRRSACRFIPPAARIEVLAPPSAGYLFVRVGRPGVPPVDLWVLADSVMTY